MKTRILTSIVAVCVLLPALYFSGTIAFCVALGAVAVISLYEMLKCMGMTKLYIALPIYLFGAAAPFGMRYLPSYAFFAAIAFICAAVYLLYLFTVAIVKCESFKFSDVALVFTVSLYIIAALCSILYVRDYGERGKYIYLLIFVGAWITDTFAYFTGVFFGKHKLIEKVSPKKTIEGSIGGIIFCTIAFVIFGVITDSFFDTEANLLFLGVGGVLISVVSQIGDLILSVIKRHYNIKDYGKIFPGHGGMLDRFDSILAVSLGIAIMCMISSLTGIKFM